MIAVPNQSKIWGLRGYPLTGLSQTSEQYESKFIEQVISIIQTKVEWESFQAQTSIGLRIEETLRRLSQQGILLKNIDDIKEYLLNFPDLIDLVPTAVDIVKKYLPDAQIVIDVYKDPEINDIYLLIDVRSKHYDDNFMEKLEKAESEFVEFLVGKEGWIQLTTHFEPQEEEGGL